MSIMAGTGGVINKPAGFAQYTDLTAARKLSDAPATGNPFPQGVVRALIQAEGAAVRWRDDGTAPVAGNGMLIADGVVLEYEGDLAKIQLIQQAAGAKINVTYYKY